MTLSLLLTGSVILLSLLISKAMRRTPLPSLLLFIALGMLFGENGLFRIPFDDYQAVDIICSTALVIIMFYGGFGTSLKAARPVLKASVLLSTAGVALSALGLAALAHYILDLGKRKVSLLGPSFPLQTRHRFFPSFAAAAFPLNTIRTPFWKLSRALTTPWPLC